MNVQYWVELSQAERDQLTGMLRGGKHAARKLSGKEEALLIATACSSLPKGERDGLWNCWPARW